MTGAHLRGFYTALLEDRIKVAVGHAKFFKKLRPGKKRSGGTASRAREYALSYMRAWMNRLECHPSSPVFL